MQVHEATAQELVGRALALIPDDGRKVLGIAGPPGAGKSTLARWLVGEINRVAPTCAAAYLPMDGFHLSNQQLERLGLASRKGAPETFDVQGFLWALQRVRKDRTDIYLPAYRRDLHEPIAAGIVIEGACRLVVVEGNYLLVEANDWESVSTMLDQSWYLSTPSGVRAERLMARSLAAGRGRDEAEAWVHRVDEANSRLIERSRHRASWIVKLLEELSSS